MNVARLVDDVEGFGHLPNEFQFVTRQVWVMIVQHHVHAKPLNILHDDEGNVVRCASVFVGLDNTGMVKVLGNLSLWRFVEPLKAAFKEIYLLADTHFQANDAIVFPIAGHIEVGHRPRNGFFEEFETLLNIQFSVTLENRLELLEDAHTKRLRWRK